MKNKKLSFGKMRFWDSGKDSFGFFCILPVFFAATCNGIILERALLLIWKIRLFKSFLKEDKFELKIICKHDNFLKNCKNPAYGDGLKKLMAQHIFLIFSSSSPAPIISIKWWKFVCLIQLKPWLGRKVAANYWWEIKSPIFIARKIMSLNVFYRGRENCKSRHYHSIIESLHWHPLDIIVVVVFAVA